MNIINYYKDKIKNRYHIIYNFQNDFFGFNTKIRNGYNFIDEKCYKILNELNKFYDFQIVEVNNKC